jgi:N-acetylgalactosamine PTS system EIIB component
LIALVRVDNRLLHGQIFEAWVPRLKISSVLVADDYASQSPLALDAMNLATPPSLTLMVRSVDEVDWRALAGAPEPVLVVFRELADLERAVAAGLTSQRAPLVNLGNVHFAPGRRAVSPSVFLSSAELDTVRRLAQRGFGLEARAVPAEDPIGVETMVERFRDDS